MKKLFSEICKLNIIYCISAALLSLLLGYTLLYAVISADSDKHSYSLYIEVMERAEGETGGSEVWIEQMELGGHTDLNEIFGRISADGFEFRKAEDYGYTGDVIVNIGGAGSTLSAEWNGSSEFSVTFWKQYLSGVLSVSLYEDGALKEQRLLDLFDESGLIRYTYNVGVYNAMEHYPIYAVVFGTLIVSAVIYAVLISVIYLIEKRRVSHVHKSAIIYIYIYNCSSHFHYSCVLPCSYFNAYRCSG